MAHENSNDMFLLVHTMTITESDYVVQAQFFHTFPDGLGQMNNARLVARRLRLRIHPELRGNRSKAIFQRLNAPSLRTLMKRNSSSIKHHLRAIHISPQVQRNNQVAVRVDGGIGSAATNPVNTQKPVPNVIEIDTSKRESPVSTVLNNNINVNSQLTQQSTPEETLQWLKMNRFEKYAQTFARFSGDDMLRMSRDDFMQICGDADGIRLHNALHLKTITPKLKIYVRRENSSVFHAIFLISHNIAELMRKLCTVTGVSQDQVRDLYMEGPHAIHVQLTNDVLQHIKEETMFSVNVMQEQSGYVFLLKCARK